MNQLKQFTSFVKQHHLDDLIQRQMDLLPQQNGIFKLLSLHNTEQRSCILKQQAVDLLTSIEENDALLWSQNKLEQLKNGLPKGADLDSVTLADITEAVTVQKLSFLHFIPSFTHEATTAIELTVALEKIYSQINSLLAKAFEERQHSFTSRLRESEEQYRDLFDNAHDLIHILKPCGQILYVNKAWMTNLGYEMEEIRGKSIYDFVDDEVREQFIQYRQAVLKGTQTDKEIVIAYRTKSGKKLFVEGFVSPRLENGTAVATRGIFRDVTARIQNEEKLKFFVAELQEREENLNQLITHAPDAIVVTDDASRIILWNPKAEEIFGWKKEEVLGKVLNETIIPEAYRQAHSAGMKRYLASGEAHILNQTIEVTALNKKQREFPISLTISRSQQGGKTIFISFSRDLSQQKKNERELLRKRLELEQSNRELEQYAWLTSHDLREPLRKILTFSDMILTRYGSGMREEVKNYMSKIQDAGIRMGNLIEAILLYSSITEDQKLFEPVNLNATVQEVLADLEVEIKDTGAEVRIEHLPTIEAVPFQMKQLLQNLINNAIKYRSPDRKPEIVISSQVKNVNAVEVTVRDNGKGFSMQDEQKIFGLFQRLSNDKNIKGTGIGLALCKKIVLNHGGTISAESKAGEGTTFTITLPIAQQH